MKTVRQYLDSIHTLQDVERHSYHGLSDAEKVAYEQRGFAIYQGKVRELIKKGDELHVLHTDRLSAFDCFIGMVPYKGTILSRMSEYWLTKAKTVVPTHLVAVPHERVLKVEAMTPYKVEVIVRSHLAGSMMRAYEAGEREFCGERLAEGLEAFKPLPEPIITPTTKAAVYEHDENTSPAELTQRGVVTADEWRAIRAMALKLFAYGQEVYREKGWLLVDTKYEFGRNAAGEIKVIDEIHTPDSSRLWVAESYHERLARGEPPVMLDKETVRRYLLDRGFKGQGAVPEVPVKLLTDLARLYLDVAERLIGEPIEAEGPLSQSPAIV